MMTRALRLHRRSERLPVFLGLVFFLMIAVASLPAQSPPGTKDEPPSRAARPTTNLLPEDWAPPDVDAAVPPVSPDVACPLPDILKGVGARLQELVDSLQRFTAKEKIEHQNVDNRGRLRGTESANFDYLAELHVMPAGGIQVAEYRNGPSSEFQGGLATAGTAAHALILHPSLIGEYAVTCEGLGTLEGKPAWQLHFVQRPDRNSGFRTYRTPQGPFKVALKGRAWIAPDSYQVLRMETDLVQPILPIRLLRDHVIVDYAPVKFSAQKVVIWLPQTADLYMAFLGRRFHQRHSFSNFALFWVETTHTEKVPKEQ